MGKSKDMKKILFHAVKFNMLSLIQNLILNRNLAVTETD